MSQSLTRSQAVVLGLVVLLAVALGGYGLVRVADRQGVWADRVELTVGFADASDITPGTAVRVRGVEAGEVVAVEDGDEPLVTVRLRLHPKYAGRLYADAAAEVQSGGVFGAKVVAVFPGTPAAGPLASGRLAGRRAAGLDEAVAEVRGLVKDVREGNGTLGRLLRDDDLYRDLKGVAADTRGLVKRADAAVGTVQGEVATLRGLAADGKETLRSVKQGTDAIGKLPVIRSYVEDANALLVRPGMNRFRAVYAPTDLFEPGTAVRAAAGNEHFAKLAAWLRQAHHPKAEVVVVAYADPADTSLTAGAAVEVTRKQAEAVVEYLKGEGVHKIGWTTRRKITPLGMGVNPPPVAETEKVPAASVQVVIFAPP